MRGSAPKLTLAAAAVLAAVVAPAAVVARARRPTHVAHRSAGAVVAASSSSSTLRTFALPAGARASGDYTVRARTPGGAWRTVGVYATQVNLSDPATSSVAVLETRGPVQVAVTHVGGPMRAVRVRPASLGVRPTLSADGRTATFTLRGAANLSLEPDGDTQRNLELFANPIDAEAAAPGSPHVVRFAPGVHELPGDHVLRVASGTTVVVAGGAVLHGRIVVHGAHDVVIEGSGIVDPSPYFDPDGPSAGITVESSSHVGIRNVTIFRGQNGGLTLVDASDVVADDLKEVNADRYSDGIDVIASRDVLLDHLFLRTSDDGVALWATSPWVGSGSTSDVTVRDSTLWPDVAHGLLVGPFGKPTGSESITGVTLDDVDVLEQDVDNPLYQGALAVNAADHLTISDVRLQDVRIAPVAEGQALNLRVFTNPDYKTAPGDAVRDVLVRDVSVASGDDAPSILSGLGPSQTVSGVLFENLRRGGAVATSPAAAHLDVGPYAKDVSVVARRPYATWDDGHGGLRYQGAWQRVRSRTAVGGAVRQAARSGAALTVAFRGRQARVVGPTGPAGGRVEVTVDGRAARTVDTYSRATSARRILFDTGDLAAGRHTLRLRVAGRHDALSRGSAVAVDALQVVG